MNRASAEHLIQRLHEIRVDRGATPNEQAIAQAKIAELSGRYNIRPQTKRTPPRARPRPQPQPFGPTISVLFGNPAIYDIPPFEFNMKTGEHSANVKVHRHQNHSNWSIEIFP